MLAADVFSTDPPLGKGSKYTVLADPKHVTGFQNVVPIVKTSVANAAGSTFTSTVNAVSATLSQDAIVAMNKAFYVDKQSAASIAKAFLEGQRPGLILVTGGGPGHVPAPSAGGVSLYGSGADQSRERPTAPRSRTAAAAANQEEISRFWTLRPRLEPRSR